MGGFSLETRAQREAKSGQNIPDCGGCSSRCDTGPGSAPGAGAAQDSQIGVLALTQALSIESLLFLWLPPQHFPGTHWEDIPECVRDFWSLAQRFVHLMSKGSKLGAFHSVGSRPDSLFTFESPFSPKPS